MSSGGKFVLGISLRWVSLMSIRWDDDVIFKNQARGTDDKRKKEFVNVSPTPLERCYGDGNVLIYLLRIFFGRISINGS
jgi:hypothetical protein